MSNNFIESSMSKTDMSDGRELFAKEDPSFETPLRPQSLDDFLGQDSLKERLEVFIGAALQRKETLGHCLFCGPPGLGKTTLASILSKAMGSNLVTLSAPVIDKPGDLAGVLTKLSDGDVLFIDEIHRLHPVVEEYLYQAMEDFTLDLVIDSGPAARSVRVPLKKFTLAGATTRAGMLSAPLRTRFALTCRLEYYSAETLVSILKRSASLLQFIADDDALMAVATRSRGTPRVANNLLRWVRDYAQIRADCRADKNVAEKALAMLQIDDRGLDEMDMRILEVLIEYYEGGPVGLNSLAIAVGEESETIEEVYEP